MDYPIVFIPGLFGSLGDDIIRGTGEFSFGFAEDIYRPFIEILNEMGYVEGKDLFISYYDWRKSVVESVNKYLLTDIENAKRKTGSKKVILIGHSLGGLLGRTYINYFYPSYIDKLIMIGTPNLGSINAYYFWSGGKLPYSNIENDIRYNAAKIGFTWYYKLFHKIDYIDAVRKVFPVARDLLPSHKYGNYLIVKENGITKEIPVGDMSIENSFLNLMENKPKDANNIFIVSGDEVNTNKMFLVDVDNAEKGKWIDGKPIKSYKTLDGDGTVTTMSALANLDVNNIVLKGSHTNILYISKDYLSYILAKPLVRRVKIRKIEKIYIIFAQGCKKINIKTSKNNHISNKSIHIMDNRVQAMSLANDEFWIKVAGDKSLKIEIDIEKESNPRIHMIALSL